MKEFLQKRGLSSRKFTLLDDRLVVETKDNFTINKHDLKFNMIGSDIIYEKDNTTPGKIMFGILLTIPFVSLIAFFTDSWEMDKGNLIMICIGYTLLALFTYFKPHKDDIILGGDKANIAFFRAIPGEQEVLDFIAVILIAVKKYHMDNYAKTDIQIPEDVFLYRLHWLKKRAFINDEEYYALKAEYDRKVQESKN